MWDTVLMTGVSALAIAGLVQPVAQKIMLGDIEHDWQANELELDSIDPVDCQTVKTKDGQYFRVMHVRGISYDALVGSKQESMLKGREALFLTLGRLNLDVRLFGIKRQHAISFEAKWPSPTLTEIAAAEKAHFQKSYYVNWYILLSSDNFRSLKKGCEKVSNTLSKYKPRILTQPQDRSADCELTSFLSYLLCGEYRKNIKAVSNSLSANIPSADYHADKNSGVIEIHSPCRNLFKVIAVTEWPEIVNGTLFHQILSINGDIEVSQICNPIKRSTAEGLYARRRREQKTPIIGNTATRDESAALEELLKQGNTAVFMTQMQIIVRADNEEKLDDIVTEVCDLLGHMRVEHSVETEGAPLCWYQRIPKKKWNKLPGLSDLYRQLDLQEQNIAALWALNHSPVGMTKSPYGGLPLRYLRTPTGQAYAFQFHVSDKPTSLGNYLVFAPSRSGKSTLIMHLLGGMAKFEDTRSFIFDSKEGARFMVEAMGGMYQGYEELSLNPLDVGEDTKKNRDRIHSVLKAMAGNLTLDDMDQEAIAHAVTLAFKLNAPERTLDNIYEYAFAKRTSLRRAFSRFVTDAKGNVGKDAHIFNAAHDVLGSYLQSSFMVGINMNEALSDSVVGPSIVTHISEAILKSAASSCKGFNIFIDEAAALKQNVVFDNWLTVLYREIGKLNGSVGMAFQDPAAMFRSGNAEAYLENTATFFFFPNSNASHESLAPFNLNEEQIGFILGGEFYERREGDRQVLIVKRDAATGLDESAIVDVDLTPLGDSLRFYRAGTDANAHLEAVKQQWGETWLNHL